jgi:site-specific DNA-methyltransferase (adenine-specific)
MAVSDDGRVYVTQPEEDRSSPLPEPLTHPFFLLRAPRLWEEGRRTPPLPPGGPAPGRYEVRLALQARTNPETQRKAERILRPGGSIYIVSGYTNLYHILAALRETGLREVNHIIWKYNFGIYTSRKYVPSHYHILFYEKPGGERTFNLESRYGAGEKAPDNGSLNYRDREDVWIINREYKPGKVKNKNELPTELLVKTIQYSSNEGDLVCDMFLGGFSTARVAIGLNRRATGFEISGQVFDLKAAEMRDVAQGWLLPSLRVPQSAGPENRGKPWTDGDQKTLISRYTGLIESGETKKNAVAIVGRELGRGRWSIEKMLKIQGVRAGRRERRAATAKRP